MKRILITQTLLMFIFLTSYTLKAQNQILVKSIVYDVPLINEEMFPLDVESYYSQTNWWTNNLETSRRWFLQQTIINKVGKGDVTAYDEAGKALTKAEIEKIIMKSDSMTIQQPYPPYNIYDTIISNYISPYEIHYLRFNESWYYDKRTYKIKKVINSYAPVISKYTGDSINNREIRNPLFWIKCSDKSEKTKGYVLLTDMLEYKCAFRNLNLRYAMWNNFVSISGDSLSRQNYVADMIKDAAAGNIKTYDATTLSNYYDYTSDETKPLKNTEIAHILGGTDTMRMQRTYPPYDIYDTVITRTTDQKNITQLKFFEKWYVNKNSLEIKKQEISVSPCLAVWDENGELRGFKILFSVLFMPPFRCY